MELSFTPNDRGQVGIGTLIVFIAMVLVAAIAAGVLINTAGFLQTQAEDTGTESTEQVANNLNVITEVGTVNDTGSGEGTISDLEVGLQPAAGSDDLNLEELSIQYVADESFSNLVHAKEVSTDQDNNIVGEDTVFNTEPVTAEDGEDNVMTDNADRYDLVIPLEDDKPFVETDTFDIEDEDGNTVDEDREIKLDIAFNTDDGGFDDLSDPAEAFNVDESEFVEVDATEDNVEQASLFHTGGDAADIGNYQFGFDDDATVDGADDEDIARVVIYEDEVNPTQLNGFDDDIGELDDDNLAGDDGLVENGALAPSFFDDLSNDNIEELVEGEEAELTFTTETGAQTVAILQVPDSLAGDDDGEAVDL